MGHTVSPKPMVQYGTAGVEGAAVRGRKEKGNGCDKVQAGFSRIVCGFSFKPLCSPLKMQKA